MCENVHARVGVFIYIFKKGGQCTQQSQSFPQMEREIKTDENTFLSKISLDFSTPCCVLTKFS